VNNILVFDFDGTLAQSLDLSVAIYNEWAQIKGFRIVTKELWCEIKMMSPHEVMRTLGLSWYQVSQVVSHIRKATYEKNVEIKPTANIADLLVSLKQDQNRLFILSSNSIDNITRFLIRNELNCFEAVYGGYGLFKKHYQLNKLKKLFPLTSYNMYYIGDEVRDIQCAHRAKVHSIAVGWGANNASALATYNPDLLVEKVEDFYPMFKLLSENKNTN